MRAPLIKAMARFAGRIIAITPCVAFLGCEALDQQVSDPGQCNKPAGHGDDEREYPQSSNQPSSEARRPVLPAMLGEKLLVRR